MSDGADRAQAEITALQQQLAHARQALDDFSHSVSHDLRAPLRHVRSYLQIVQEDMGDRVDPALIAHLRTASEAAVHMGRMMDALLEISRLQVVELQPVALDISMLITDARRALEAQHAGNRPVDWRIAAQFPLVQADMALASQMVTRLLSNAFKFTQRVPMAVIDIGWRPHGAAGWCEIYVRDNGVGFDPRAADRMFQVFQRLHSVREFEGLGVGLAFARIAVERHGGSIRARGDMAPGCELCFTLPLAPGAALPPP